MGLIKTTVTAPADKAKPTDKKTTPTATVNVASKEEKKLTGIKDTDASKKPVNNTKPTIAFSNGDKKKTTEESDPIDDSLKLRIKAGGVTEVVQADKKAIATAATKTAPTATTKTATSIPATKLKEEKKSDKPVTTVPTTTKTQPIVADKSKDGDKRR